jgi:hypothetical protein
MSEPINRSKSNKSGWGADKYFVVKLLDNVMIFEEIQ